MKMKRIFFILLITLSSINLFSLPKEKPTPLANTNFEYPELGMKNLSNGVKVFLMNNSEQPTIAISVMIKTGKAQETKIGSVELLSALLSKGAGKRNAQELAELLDGTGTNISVDDRKDYIIIQASGLKKNQNTICEVLADIILFPKLDGSEFDKLKKQKSSEISLQKNESFNLVSRLSSKLLYGANNAYSNYLDEKGLNDLNLEDVKKYYVDFFKANNSCISITGDFEEDKILANLDKYFKKWNNGELPNREVAPFKAEAAGVYFIARPASVQSSINVIAKVSQAGDQEHENTQMVANVMGSGFMGRLFKTLRETHSYCYSPYSFQTNNKLGNMLMMGAEVRNEVTDSALTVLLKEINILKTQNVPEKELEQIKQYNLGQFYLGFEDPKFLLNKVLIGEINGISYESIKAYPDRIKNTLPSDIISSANNYLTALNTYIVVVGDESVREKVEKFGLVTEYDMDIQPNVTAEKVNFSPKDLMNKYIAAIGGSDNLDKVKTIKSNAVVDLDAGATKINGNYEEVRANSKLYIKMDLSSIKSEIIYDGTKGYSINAGESREVDATELKFYQYLATPFRDGKLIELGYKCEVKGKRNGLIIMKANIEGGNEYTYFFDENTFLIKKIESIEISQNIKIASTSIIDSYIKVGEVLFPKILKTQNNFYSATFLYDYKVNESVSEEIFKLKQ